MQFIAAKQRNGVRGLGCSERSIKDKLANTLCTKPKQLSVLQDMGCQGGPPSAQGVPGKEALDLKSSLKCHVDDGSSELILINIKWECYWGTQTATNLKTSLQAEQKRKRRENKPNPSNQP